MPGYAARVRVAADQVDGPRDLAWLLAPSRARALALDKAYLAVVREQSFTRGRDAVLRPATRVHVRVDDEDTGLGASGRSCGGRGGGSGLRDAAAGRRGTP